MDLLTRPSLLSYEHLDIGQATASSAAADAEARKTPEAIQPTSPEYAVGAVLRGKRGPTRRAR